MSLAPPALPRCSYHALLALLKVCGAEMQALPMADATSLAPVLRGMDPGRFCGRSSTYVGATQAYLAHFDVWIHELDSPVNALLRTHLYSSVVLDAAHALEWAPIVINEARATWHQS